jgi:DNA-binding IclR family transcriptional regulator
MENSELNRALVDSIDFLFAARNHTQLLADQLRATIHLAALRQHEVVYLSKAIGRNTNDFTASGVGLAAPLHCIALGKVLLAALDTEAADALIDRHGLGKRTAVTITNSERRREELLTTRIRGCGYDLEESFDHLCRVAAPIRDINGYVQAAISASVPLQYFHTHRDLLQRNIRTVAVSISRARR